MATIVGIDLGTTYSLIARMKDGLPVIIRDENERTQVPSVVSIENGEVMVGETAREHVFDRPKETVYSVKRFMGRAYEDFKDRAGAMPFLLSSQSAQVLTIDIDGKCYTPPEISAMILRRLKAQAEAALDETIDKAVITVPAYFNDAQRQATRDAGKLAGLDVLRIVNEPTAAALAYGLNRSQQGIVAVYDLGGGTFDISILKLSLGVFEVLATCGDTELGGDDMDRAIWTFMSAEIEEQYGHKPDSAHDHQLLRTEAERVKCELSDEDEALFRYANKEKKIDFTRIVTRSEFEQWIEPVITRTRVACRRAMKDAGVEPSMIDEAVLVGGSTRAPAVRALVKKIFEREPHDEIDPDEVVALGAAVQAAILAGEKTDMLLLDVTPLSLGIETYGNVMSSIIGRNTTVPASASETFTTFVEGQRNVEIHVLQGERELASENRSLARFTLKDIPPMPAGMPRIEVKFTIDADGILHVHAKDQRTGVEQAIDVKPSYGLTDEEVERMLLDSVEYAEEDFKARQLIESRNDLEIVITATKKSLKTNGQVLKSAERAEIDEWLTKLEGLMEAESFEPIREAMVRFEMVVRPLTERQVDLALKEALQNKSLDDIQI